MAAWVDKEKKVWYGEMMIPLIAIGQREPMWTPVNQRSHHTTKEFGRMVWGR